MYNFKEIEEKSSKITSKKEIKKAVQDDKSRKKLFSFLEGPPTANAPPGLHHLEVRTYKDIINKFKYMQGFNVPRKAGWDCHGLPVEVQVEKNLKLNNKKDILKFGEAKFIEECRKSVFSHISEWNKSTEKLGYWIDLDDPYITLNNDYIESVWWSLKKLYDKKLLYEAHKVVPFCPRCETPLSSHEVAQGYKKIKEDSVIVKFKLKKEKNVYFLVFTTTPWTLPSNVAIAVNKNLEYSYVEDKKTGEIYIITSNLVSNYFENPKIIKKVNGSKLIGEKYEPLFDYFKDLDGFRVINGDFVTESDGTGLVHMAPAFGEVDYDACKAEGLPFVQPVDETGHFTDEVPDYKGVFIKSVDKKIIERLKEEDKLFKIIKYEHDYPFCWRCDTPLMYYAIKSWFIKVTAYKEKLLELNEKINWTPKHIQEGRFGEWLKNVKDWALSRKKFWGTPLPIWRCECGNEEIIGSIDDLKKRASKKISDKEMDLHKPWIDNIKLKCSECKKEMSRIPDVIDCWYDSGAASFAQFHYPFENEDEFKKRVPYDFITEAIDQTRGWFYTLHVLSTILFGNIAYKNVICAGHIVDEKGEKMSKTKGNVLDPDMVLDTLGIDATRLQFCTVNIGAPKKFGIETVKKEITPFLNTLWNIYQFYEQINNQNKAIERIEDKWIVSRLNSIVNEVTKSLEEYQIEKALNPLMEFVINDFSKTYIKIIRDRDDKNVEKVIGEVLEKVSKMLAPFAPNITSVIYNELKRKNVHFSDWPLSNIKLIDEKLEEEFKNVLNIIEKGLRERDREKIGLKWPLAKAIVKIDGELNKELLEIIMNQLNVKKVEVKKGKELEVNLDTRMTKELEAEGYAREISRKVQAFRKESGLVKTDRIKLAVSVDEKFSELLKNQKEFIKERTNSNEISIGKVNEKDYKYRNQDKIKDFVVNIFFSKI